MQHVVCQLGLPIQNIRERLDGLDAIQIHVPDVQRAIQPRVVMIIFQDHHAICDSEMIRIMLDSLEIGSKTKIFLGDIRMTMKEIPMAGNQFLVFWLLLQNGRIAAPIPSGGRPSNFLHYLQSKPILYFTCVSSVILSQGKHVDGVS